MRRFRIVAIGLILLLASWVVWRQLVQHRRTARQHGEAARSALPAWAAAPTTTPDASAVAGTAERTHNQSDALTQPQELAALTTAQANDQSAPDQHADFGSAPGAEPETGSNDQAQQTAPDDLIRIEGIGPKVSTIVMAEGITTFTQLAATDVERLRAILEQANIHTIDPTTWPRQAHLAAQGKWQQLQELQDRIKNGRLDA